MKNHKKKGQTFLEYTIVITIILGAFLAIQTHFKRGIQGRWKSAVDTLGEQYDPRVADSNLRHTIVRVSNTDIVAVDTGTGYITTRQDRATSIEKKTGYASVGSY